MYEGTKQSDSEVSISCTWATAVILEKVDGKELQANIRESHVYVLPSDHEFQIHVIRLRAYHFLCGALCDAIFNKPRFVRASTLPGHPTRSSSSMTSRAMS
jgi:hypothetical protein